MMLKIKAMAIGLLMLLVGLLKWKSNKLDEAESKVRLLEVENEIKEREVDAGVNAITSLITKTEEIEAKYEDMDSGGGKPLDDDIIRMLKRSDK